MGVRSLLYANRGNVLAQARSIAAGRVAETWAEICAPFAPFDFSLDAHAKALGEAADEAEQAEARRDAKQGKFRNEAADVRAIADKLNRWRLGLFKALDAARDLPAAQRLATTFEEAGSREPLSPRAARAQIVKLLTMIEEAGGLPKGMRIRADHVATGKALVAETNQETVERDATEKDRQMFTGEVLRAYQRLNNLVVELEDVMGLVEIDLGGPVPGLHLGVIRAVRGRAGKYVTDEELAEDGEEPVVERPADGAPDVVIPPVRPVEG